MSYYTPEERREIQEKWIARMEDWQKSGLSAATWCRQKEVIYHQLVQALRERIVFSRPPQEINDHTKGVFHVVGRNYPETVAASPQHILRAFYFIFPFDS